MYLSIFLLIKRVERNSESSSFRVEYLHNEDSAQNHTHAHAVSLCVGVRSCLRGTFQFVLRANSVKGHLLVLNGAHIFFVVFSSCLFCYTRQKSELFPAVFPQANRRKSLNMSFWMGFVKTLHRTTGGWSEKEIYVCLSAAFPWVRGFLFCNFPRTGWAVTFFLFKFLLYHQYFASLLEFLNWVGLVSSLSIWIGLSSIFHVYWYLSPKVVTF